MKYKLFLYNDKPAVVFIDKTGTISRYSENKGQDIFFTEWLENAKKENLPTSFDDVTTGFSYYTSDAGNYESDKTKIDKILKDFGYDAP